MAEPFHAEIRMFGLNFAPRGWAFCNGSLLSIVQNTALFALVGTTYGGDGVQTFALPNLQGSVPIGQGTGPGLEPYVFGQTGGTAAIELSASEVPAHTHTVVGSTATATLGTPGPTALLASGGVATYGGAQNLVAMLPLGNPATPHNNLQPFLALTFCIALQGIFPARP
jgi:microcystin-dependent protein